MMLAPRPMGYVNWLGLWTLYAKEVRRFVKVYMQTIFGPVANSLLFLCIFVLALGGRSMQAGGVDYPHFLAPGLIMAAMMQNSFANTSSSLLMAKIQGNIVDILMPPLSSGELLTALVMGGLTRGLVVGLAVLVPTLFFVSLGMHSLGAILFFAVGASLMLSVLGLLGGIWSEKFDHLASVTNFIVMPLSFLSGTFYSIERLPEPFHLLALGNPFFYMIDGFRYGFTGYADGSVMVGAAIVTIADLVLLGIAYILLRKGYRLKV